MESPAKFSHAGLDGKVDLIGEGKVIIGEDSVSVLGNSSSVYSISVRDVKMVKAADYRIEIGTGSGSLVLFNMGYRYEDVLREVHRARNETLISDTLAYETPKRQSVKGMISVMDKGPTPLFEGKAEVRLYETTLVIVPEMSSIVRMRYSDIVSVLSQDWTLDISEESGRKVSVRMLGKEHDPLFKAISDQVGEMKLRARNIIKTIHPGIPDEELSKLSVMMREGKAASMVEITSVSPGFVGPLEKRLIAELPDSYPVLMAKGNKEMTRFGFKHGLMDGVTGDYIWFLVPIIADVASSSGNAIAFEASGSDSSRATYLFRIAGRKEYPGFSASEKKLTAEAALERTVNALVEINFRREPIYLDEAALLSEAHTHYRYAINALPGLRDLRERFIGRVQHVSTEQYVQQIDDLLTFNTTSRSDSDRWKGPETEGPG